MENNGKKTMRNSTKRQLCVIAKYNVKYIKNHSRKNGDNVK